MIPHPEKRAKGGEDAAYVDDGILVVADGVGGWASRGVDPAIYSKKLVLNVQNLWKGDKERFRFNPKELIIQATRPLDVLGSSTLVICTLSQENPMLYSAYMGDSGYMIFRAEQEGGNLNFVYQSPEMQKSFNFPYQLGYRGNGDDPSLSWTQKHTMKNNDIVVVGSDGLFDNLDSQQIGDILKKATQHQHSLEQAQIQQIANTIANTAYSYSLDKMYMSPFAQKAKQQGLFYAGGKSDDITVVVAQVKSNSQ